MNLHDPWPAGIPRPRDYLQTSDELFFAVVSSVIDEGHALSSLRYVRRNGVMLKLDTEAAHGFLREHRPSWLVHSPLIDALIHRVPLNEVTRVHRPDDRMAWLRRGGTADELEARALRAAAALGRHGATADRLGLGGSLLLGAQHGASDIDLIAYGRDAFHAARGALAAAVKAGALAALDGPAWEAAWARRGGALGLDEYVRGEARKWNKATLEGTRIDLTLVVNHQEEVAERVPFTKLGRITVQALVTDATCAFDHPARYRVQHDEVSEVVSFTPTYAGQVEAGEMLEASGWLESDADGVRRAVVGTSREADGECVRKV